MGTLPIFWDDMHVYNRQDRGHKHYDFRCYWSGRPEMTSLWVCTRDRRDQKFRDDTDTDTLWGPESRPILILILRLSLHRDRYWYWYHEFGPGLILIPIFYLIRILPGPSKKCSGLWIDTDTDTETPEIPGPRLILILAALVSVLSIRYRYSRLSLIRKWPDDLLISKWYQ